MAPSSLAGVRPHGAKDQGRSRRDTRGPARRRRGGVPREGRGPHLPRADRPSRGHDTRRLLLVLQDQGGHLPGDARPGAHALPGAGGGDRRTGARRRADQGYPPGLPERFRAPGATPLSPGPRHPDPPLRGVRRHRPTRHAERDGRGVLHRPARLPAMRRPAGPAARGPLSGARRPAAAVDAGRALPRLAAQPRAVLPREAGQPAGEDPARALPPGLRPGDSLYFPTVPLRLAKKASMALWASGERQRSSSARSSRSRAALTASACPSRISALVASSASSGLASSRAAQSKACSSARPSGAVSVSRPISRASRAEKALPSSSISLAALGPASRGSSRVVAPIGLSAKRLKGSWRRIEWPA